MKRVSIIIPIHNAEKYLEKCLNSILVQITKDDEIILINDSSTDKSQQICEQYAKNYDIIKNYHERNGGPSKTRNSGLQKAQGKYILFIDADDYLEKSYIEEMLKEMEEVQLKVCGYSFVYEETGKIKQQVYRPHIKQKILTIPKEDFIYLYKRQLLNLVWNKIYLAEIIKKYEIRFDESVTKGEDLLFNLDYILHMQSPITIVNQALYNYVSKKTGLNRSFKEPMENCMHRTNIVYQKMKKVTNTHNNEIIAEIINMYFIHLRNNQKEKKKRNNKQIWVKQLDRPEIKNMLQQINRQEKPNLVHIKTAYEKQHIYRMLLENKIRLLLNKEDEK